MRRGFTLIELSFVLAVIALLVGLTIPNYVTLVRRAHADEARTMVSAIAHAELRYHRDHGQFLACGSVETPPTHPIHFPGDLPCWRALGIATDGEVRYSYAASVDPTSFRVVARADLDANGVASKFTLDGRTLLLDIENELE